MSHMSDSTKSLPSLVASCPSFNLTATPGTDIWRKPGSPGVNAFNATTHLTEPIPISHLKRARITFHAHWTTLYDQGGLLLQVTKKSADVASAESTTSMAEHRWIKTGVEFYQKRPYISTVGCEKWSDWSVYPVSADEASKAGHDPESGHGYTIEVVRTGSAFGSSLWIYWIVDGERRPIRDLGWWFGDEADDWDLRIGAYAARPAEQKDVVGEVGLKVTFSGFELDINENTSHDPVI